MSSDFLSSILSYKKELLEKKRPLLTRLKEKMTGVRHTRYSLFKRMISNPGRVSLIAEIKKASPSKGLIREDFDAVRLATVYAKNGADAISVLTEDKFFLGDTRFVRKVSHEFDLPVLAKDFFVDDLQIYEAKHNGASAVLLISSILDERLLVSFLETARALDMDCLVEVHDKVDLDKALSAGAEIIGVNNRDLTTFEVSLSACEMLIPMIPCGKVIVAESGISGNEQVRMLSDLGADAVLIGEAFMRSDDVGAKMREVMGNNQGGGNG